MPKAFITVTLKEGLFDAQGAAAQKALQQLGHDFVQGVSIGKFITLDMDDVHSAEELESRIDQMCRQLLANPVIEEYEIRMADGLLASSKGAARTDTAASVSKSSVREPFSFDYTMYGAMSTEEQLDFRSQALLKHGSWIMAQLDERDADWILVIGGEVVDSGASLGSYPSEERLRELGTANGLVPWVFTRPSH